MSMLTRFSERIFNQSRYTDYIYEYAHSFLGKDCGYDRVTYFQVNKISRQVFGSPGFKDTQLFRKIISSFYKILFNYEKNLEFDMKIG